MIKEQKKTVKTVKDLTDTLPGSGKMEVLEHLLITVEAKDLEKLSSESRKQLLAVFPEVPAKSTSSSELVRNGGRAIVLSDGSNAIETHVYVNSEIIRAVLSESSFYKTRDDQIMYASGLDGRLASRGENCAVVEDLLKKESQNTLNQKEKELLTSYCTKYVRDLSGGLYVAGRRVIDNDNLNDNDNPNNGALVVLPLAESK